MLCTQHKRALCETSELRANFRKWHEVRRDYPDGNGRCSDDRENSLPLAALLWDGLAQAQRECTRALDQGLLFFGLRGLAPWRPRLQLQEFNRPISRILRLAPAARKASTSASRCEVTAILPPKPALRRVWISTIRPSAWSMVFCSAIVETAQVLADSRGPPMNSGSDASP